MTSRNRIIPPPPASWDSWEILMHLALEEARKAESAGEVPVGALIVTRTGEIIGRGYNQVVSSSDPTAHAEIVALRDAATRSGNYRLSESYMVVTLEPCFMCTGALVHARLAGVVFGAPEPKTGTIISCLDGLDLPFHNTQVWHMGHVCEKACAALLHDFFTLCRHRNET